MPPVQNEYDSSLGHAAEALATKWHTCDVMGIGSNGPQGAGAGDISGWGAEQICYFLVGHVRCLRIFESHGLPPLCCAGCAAAAGLQSRVARHVPLQGLHVRLVVPLNRSSHFRFVTC